MSIEENATAPDTDGALPISEAPTGGEPDATAAPVSDEATPEEGPTEAAPKTFTQDELDAIVAKRLAREQRKWEREQQSAQPAASEPQGDEPLTTEQIIANYEAQREQKAIADQYFEREEAALEKYDDFQQVAYNPALTVTDDMALAIQSSDIGPDILYHLGQNPKEAARISRLSPIQRVREIGKIEATIAANPPARKTTGAPAPITPVTPRSNGNTTDTTDPRSIQAMSTSEWIEADRARLMKKLSATR